jgi:LPS export ABC transporter protein LptC
MLTLSKEYERFYVIRIISIVLVVATVSACSSELDDRVVEHKKESATAPSSDNTTPTGENAMQVQGLELTMREKPKADGSEQLPTFRVTAETGTSDNGVDYTFLKPRALVYDDDGEKIVLTADSGDYNQKIERARLNGAVRIGAGDLELSSKSITWDNTTGLAISENGVTLTSEGANLKADYLSLEPSTNEYRMKKVSGTISWEGNNK